MFISCLKINKTTQKKLSKISRNFFNINFYLLFNYGDNILMLFSAGVISLLDEQSPDLKGFALKKLDTIVDEFWPEISESIEKM